jgi:hypothetical protein
MFIDRGTPRAVVKYLCNAMLLFATSTLDGQEVVVQYYIPSVFGIVSGEGAGFHQFKQVVKSRFLVPIETKILLTTLFDEVGLSGLGTITTYFEDGILGSFNVSLGVGFHEHNQAKTSFLQGVFISLYPLYEFPLVMVQGGTMNYWKMAIDIGIGLDVFSTPLYTSIYMRMILLGDDSHFTAFPDFGLTIGLRFKGKPRRPGNQENLW